MARALLLCVLVCGCGARPAATSTTSVDRATSLRRQLDGHLARARDCLDRPGWVELAFTIRTDGRVADVDVDAWNDDDGMLAACVRSRIVSLYFDPAPPSREVRISRTMESCPGEGLCRFGVRADAPAELLERIDRSLAERDDEVRACAARLGGGRALLDVRLEVAPDGRIMAGQVRRASPDRTPLARCAVGPLLGTTIAGPAPEETLHVRHAIALH